MKKKVVSRLPRIAFVTNVGYSLFQENIKETYGGGQIDLYLLAHELIKTHRYEVSMIFLDYGQPDRQNIDGINLFKSYAPRDGNSFIWQSIKAALQLWKALSKANADIYFHEGAELEIAISRIFCIIFRRRLVFRCANIIDVDGRYQKAHPFYGRLFSFGLAGSHAIIAQTKEQQYYLDKLNKRSVIIGNMISTPVSTNSKKRYIVWVGRLTKIKHPEQFLNLARHFPKDEFLMLGPIDAIDQEFARSIQLKAGEIENLTYIEKIPFRETMKIFDEARLLVNTSDYEGFPMTFVQAMSAGVPILTTGIDPDYIVSRVAGIVTKSENDFFNKYSELSKPEVWSGFAEASIEYAKNYFSPEVIVPKYEALFEQVLSS